MTAAEPYRRARLGLGYVPQGREIFPGLTVYDNLRMGCTQAGWRRAGDHRRSAGGISPPQAAARPRRRRAVGRRAAAAGDRALPVRQAAAGPARRADRRHPALDHRRDRRDPAAAARQERAHHDPGRAESRFHRRALAADSHHPEGHDHPGSAAGRSRRSRVLSENSSESPPKPDPAGSQHRETDHGSQKTHSRSIAQRRRGSRHAYGRGGAEILRRADAGELRRLRRRRCHAGLRAGREISAHARLSSRRRGEQVQRLVRQDRDQGRAERQARRQDRSR